MKIPGVIWVDLKGGEAADGVARRVCGTVVCVDRNFYTIWFTEVLSPTRVQLHVKPWPGFVREYLGNGRYRAVQKDPPLREPAVLDRLAEISAQP